jgi:hypothetical protein
VLVEDALQLPVFKVPQLVVVAVVVHLLTTFLHHLSPAQWL